MDRGQLSVVSCPWSSSVTRYQRRVLAYGGKLWYASSMRRSMASQRRGFSLTDLLVVLVLAMVALAVALVALRRVRQAQSETQTVNNLLAMANACHFAHATHKCFPPAWGEYGNPPVSGSLHFHLLPFLKQDALYENYYSTAVIPEFTSLADPSFTDGNGVQNFAANLRVFSNDGVISGHNADIVNQTNGFGKTRFATIQDGISNTIMFATRLSDSEGLDVTWGAPNCSAYDGKPYTNNGAFFGQAAARTNASAATAARPTFQLAPSPDSVDCAVSAFAHSFGSKLHTAYCDGSFRAINSNIGVETWNRAMAPADLPMIHGEVE